MYALYIGFLFLHIGQLEFRVGTIFLVTDGTADGRMLHVFFNTMCKVSEYIHIFL